MRPSPKPTWMRQRTMLQGSAARCALKHAGLKARSGRMLAASTEIKVAWSTQFAMHFPFAAPNLQCNEGKKPAGGYGSIWPYVQHLRCHLCGKCVAALHTWAWHVTVGCPLKHLTELSTGMLRKNNIPVRRYSAFPRPDLQKKDTCRCAADIGYDSLL